MVTREKSAASRRRHARDIPLPQHTRRDEESHKRLFLLTKSKTIPPGTLPHTLLTVKNPAIAPATPTRKENPACHVVKFVTTPFAMLARIWRIHPRLRAARALLLALRSRLPVKPPAYGAGMAIERTLTPCRIRVRGEGRDRRHQARERGVTQLATTPPRP